MYFTALVYSLFVFLLKLLGERSSPTLGCSIENLRDIYICLSCPKCIGGITWPKHAHAQSQFRAVKTDL